MCVCVLCSCGLSCVCGLECAVPSPPDCAFIIVVCVVRPWGVQRRGSDERTGQESDSAQRMALSLGTPSPQGKKSLGSGVDRKGAPSFHWQFCMFKLTLVGWDRHLSHCSHTAACCLLLISPENDGKVVAKLNQPFNSSDSKEFLNDWICRLLFSVLYIWEGWLKLHPGWRAAEWLNPFPQFDLWRSSPQSTTLLELGRG